ncbi:hypothetical protein AVEN_148945-1 [Araneus ventricosus]|uniref:Uncharacterized protein n=1 Tax=Araneus ventricosus TaxID=182803 RepID=A0A4Y2FPX2_ARAVE|nr:hypothetical protein AVEN_148945-1 [Araneus ventricosus]
MEIQLRWKSKLSFSLHQLSSGFHIDEWVWHPVFQKKWTGTLVNVLLQGLFYVCNDCDSAAALLSYKTAFLHVLFCRPFRSGPPPFPTPLNRGEKKQMF